MDESLNFYPINYSGTDSIAEQAGVAVHHQSAARPGRTHLTFAPLFQLYNIFPRLMDVLPGPHHQIFRNFEKLRQFIAERIRWHQRHLDPQAPQDFIDCFLIRMEQVLTRELSLVSQPTVGGSKHGSGCVEEDVGFKLRKTSPPQISTPPASCP